MNRRSFLQRATSLAAATAIGAPRAAQAAREEPTPRGDALNPDGVRVAGIRMIPVAGGKYKVWTKRIGAGPVKVLLLHGGPGASHDYLEAMESFLPEAGVEMYYYDQLGSGNSDAPDDPNLWTLPRFLAEVEEVRRGLGLDGFVLYGHSWGGTLAMEYALNFPQHLRGLVVSNMTAGTQAYLRRTAALKQQLLSPETYARFVALEQSKDYDNPEFSRILWDELYSQMLCRLKPWPEPFQRAIPKLNQQVYGAMQGRSEFEVVGNLKDWERWDRLPEIKVKTLTIGSRYDEMDPADMQRMATLLPDATCAICEQGSHLCMWDDQAAYFRHLLKFLREV